MEELTILTEVGVGKSGWIIQTKNGYYLLLLGTGI